MVEGGWSRYRTAVLLGVSTTTVSRWVDAGYRERKDAERRVRRATESRRLRAQALSDAGLDDKAVAKVMSLDFDEEWSAAEVRAALS